MENRRVFLIDKLEQRFEEASKTVIYSFLSLRSNATFYLILNKHFSEGWENENEFIISLNLTAGFVILTLTGTRKK